MRPVSYDVREADAVFIGRVGQRSGNPIQKRGQFRELP